MEKKSNQKAAPAPLPSDDKITQKFQGLIVKFPFYKGHDTPGIIKEFITLFKVMKLIGDCIETPDDEAAYLHAFKVMVLFGGNKKSPTNLFERYLKSNNFLDQPNPVHGALLNAFPQDEKIHLKEWRNIIQKTESKKAVELFALAETIEVALGGKAPSSLQEAAEIAKSLTYKRYQKYPELAELCSQYKVAEDKFDECLELKKTIKDHDDLPDVIIDGNTIHQPGYVLLKLPINDPRAFILGKLTACCQSIDGEGNQFVREDILSPTVGFYIMLKRYKKNTDRKPITPFYIENGKINYLDYEIVGQGLAWISMWGNLTFDSWENQYPTRDDPVIIALLETFAKEVIYSPTFTIDRITIGKGGKTPAYFCENKPIVSERNLDSKLPDYDSATQSEIHCHREKKAITFQRLTQLLSPFFELEKKENKKIMGDINDLCYSEKFLSELETLFKIPIVQDFWKSLPLQVVSLSGYITDSYDGFCNKYHIFIDALMILKNYLTQEVIIAES